MSKGRKKIPIYASGLDEARAWDAGALTGQDLSGLRYQLTFDRAHGIAGLEGRKVVATLTGPELATAVGAIPALSVKGEEDMAALARVLRMLRES